MSQRAPTPDQPLHSTDFVTAEPAAAFTPLEIEIPDRYHIYTTDFDEIIPRSALSDSNARTESRTTEKYTRPMQNDILRSAHRFHPAPTVSATDALMVVLDVEAGVLDSTRLTRVVTDPLEPLVYKEENAAPFPETVVTLLIDHSGSMEGRTHHHCRGVGGSSGLDPRTLWCEDGGTRFYNARVARGRARKVG